MKRTSIIIILSALALAGLPSCSKPGPADAGHEEKSHDEHGDHGVERIKLSAEQLANAALKIEEAAPATIRTMVAVYGKVAANEEALAHVVPRFPGVVKSVRKRLGDSVERGEVLAQIEGNESLKTYDVTSEIAGTVIQKDITLGELVKDDKTVFTVADLGTVWIDLSIFRRDFGSLAVGSAVEFHTGDGHVSGQQHIQAKVDYISPFGSEGSQTMLARCVVPNPTGILRPGLYVDGEVVTGEIDAAVTVKNGALQEIDGNTVVVVAEGDAFEARVVEIGVKDNERVEVISGLRPGERYVAANSFVMKAELGKGEAEHEH
jgi:cobalt-zinc-cadmium efflux system membrane fusion protein